MLLDESGDSIILGETSDVIDLPNGINLDNGEISGITSELTNKQGDVWTFSFFVEDSEMTVVLPRDSTIKTLSDGEISVNGNQISVFVENGVEIEYTIESGDKINIRDPGTTIPLLIVGAALILIVIVYMVNFGKREKKEEKPKRRPIKKKDDLEIIKQVLSDREKLILDKLKETGKIKSSYLRKMVDIPKASFSRHIQELEKKGLVKRTGEGKNKLVELVKK